VVAENVPSIESILNIQRDGVAAIVAITGRFDDTDWQRRTPCEAWTALDLAGHVITATTMWHQALDDAETGVTTPRLRWDDLSRHNQEYLESLPAESGPNRIETFAQRANDWFERVSRLDPALPIPVALQDIAAVPITLGLFAWAGGLEWHLHAWDFAQVIGEEYFTPHAETISAGIMATRGLSPRREDGWEHIISNLRAAPG
jgi:hypothetical protein